MNFQRNSAGAQKKGYTFPHAKDGVHGLRDAGASRGEDGDVQEPGDGGDGAVSRVHAEAGQGSRL